MTASLIHRHRQRPPCPCGSCTVEHGFCPGHRARLARFRDQFDAAATAKSRDGARKRSSGVPSCCRPGCWYPREVGQSFCSECADLGYADGIGE